MENKWISQRSMDIIDSVRYVPGMYDMYIYMYVS